MTESTPSTTGSSSSSNPPLRRTRRTWRLLAIPVLTVFMLIGGGWWVAQAGLLGQWLTPTTQTASSVARGVQAQQDQTATGSAGQAQNGRPPAIGVFTGTFPAGGPPNGVQPPALGQGARSPSGVLTNTLPSTVDLPVATLSGDQAPGLVSGATPADSEDAASPVDATSVAAPNLVTIPAVAGVKGSRLYDDSGVLLATLQAGDSVLITARSDDSTWLSVIGKAGVGWVQAGQLIAYGLQRLPELALPEAVAAAAAEQASAPDVALGAVPDSSLTVSVTATGASAPITNSAAAATQPVVMTAIVATDDARLNLRTGPGIDYSIIAKAENGVTYSVLGRNAGGDWLQLQLDGATVGWAAAAFLQLEGDVDDLPVRLAPAPTLRADAAKPASGSASATSVTAAEIILVNNTTGAATALAQTNSASAAADLAGTLVFQQGPGGMIYAYDLAGGDLWPLTNGFDPAISPDGSTVAFTRDGGQTGLYLIAIDGSNERRIFDRAALSSPKWSPDGQWIVFTRNDEGVECYQVSPRFCMLPDEAKKRFPMGVPDTFPLVTEYQYKLSTVDLNGDNYHDIPSLNSARAADWSDAGIVYQSSSGIQITADATGDVNRSVAFDNLNPYYYDPDLQPGGGQIVFQVDGAAQTDLWVVNADGTGRVGLTRPKTTLVDALPSNVAAAYSPDGKSIVFLSNRTENGEAGDWHLWVMNADGSNQRQLPIDLPLDYTYGDDQTVSWGG